jgi:hypothetical protein
VKDWLIPNDVKKNFPKEMKNEIISKKTVLNNFQSFLKFPSRGQECLMHKT